MSLVVVSSRIVCFPRGVDGFGVVSQVTEVRVGGVVGYVRENRRATSAESFAQSSNARLGHKADGDRIGVEVLELAAPPASWDSIAAEVRRLDTLGREVLRSPRWSLARASELVASGRRSGGYL